MNGTDAITEPTVSAKWRALFALLPGYDPIATADPGQWFDEAEAEQVVAFFAECLTHTKGKLAGKPLILEPWEQAWVGCLLGWRNADGTRRYRESMLYIARKNGKTTLAAGIVLYMLLVDGEMGAEIYSAAAEREQAAIIYSIARQMVANEPELAGRVQVFRGVKTLSCDERGASYKAISADAHTKHGFNSSCVIIDELHAQLNRDLVDVLQTSTGSRAQPLLLHTTTADFDRPSICNEKHNYACAVRDGIIRDSAFFPVIFEASRDDDWTDEATWEKANPNIDVAISRSYLRRECNKAQENPAYENTFKRLHLNIVTEQAIRCIPMEAWDRCDAEPLCEPGQPVWGALDIGATRDLCAMVMSFQNDEGEPTTIEYQDMRGDTQRTSFVRHTYSIVPTFWMPEKPVSRDPRMNEQILAWKRAGLIIETPGDVVDYDQVFADIVKLVQPYSLQAFAIDQGFQGVAITQGLQRVFGERIIGFRQGILSMAPPCREILEMAHGGRMRHGGHPVLRWMASNVAAETRGGLIKFSKDRSSEKIDGMTALAMAIGVAMICGDDGSSIYDDAEQRPEGLLLV